MLSAKEIDRCTGSRKKRRRLIRKCHVDNRWQGHLPEGKILIQNLWSHQLRKYFLDLCTDLLIFLELLKSWGVVFRIYWRMPLISQQEIHPKHRALFGRSDGSSSCLKQDSNIGNVLFITSSVCLIYQFSSSFSSSIFHVGTTSVSCSFSLYS